MIQQRRSTVHLRYNCYTVLTLCSDMHAYIILGTVFLLKIRHEINNIA
jgi:hypothetical protein